MSTGATEALLGGGFGEDEGEELGFGGAQGRFLGVPDDYRRPQYDDNMSATKRMRYNQTGDLRQTGQILPRYDEAAYNASIAQLADSPESVFRMQQDLARVGLIGPKTKVTFGQLDSTTRNAYRKLLEYANIQGLDERNAYQRLLNAPRGALGEDGLGGADGLGGGGGAAEKPFTGSKKTQTKDVDHLNPTEARRLMRATLRDALGRAPSDGEYKAFAAALRSTEDANPVITDTTTNFVEGEATGSTQFRNGGVDAAGFAEEFAQEGAIGKEANTFKVATDYYSAAMSVLGEGGGA